MPRDVVNGVKLQRFFLKCFVPKFGEGSDVDDFLVETNSYSYVCFLI